MNPTIREARASDITDIVRLLADDPLGATRESFDSPLPDSYRQAFDAIKKDPNNELVVALRFYEKFGFVPSHHGMKLKLEIGR